MNKLKLSTIVLATILSAVSFNSFAAGEANNVFQSTATVNASCDIQANNLDFGEFTPEPTGEMTLKSSLSFRCSNATNYIIRFNVGSGPSYEDRTMLGQSGNPDVLHYNLYTEGSNVIVWGDNSGSTQYVSGVSNGEDQLYSIYARLPLNQYVQPGTYTDEITAEVTY